MAQDRPLPIASDPQGTPRYITSASLDISGSYWIDVWLNGVPILENLHPTMDGQISHKISYKEHLCYFQKDNVLAIKVSDSKRNPRPQDPRIGLAYVLKIGLSDGSEEVLSSDEVDQHNCFYRPVPEGTLPDPMHWTRPGFKETFWQRPRSVGSLVPGLVTLIHPQTGEKVQFMTASGISSQVENRGERHFFRRRFFLDIVPNPICLHTPTATPKPRLKATATSSQTPTTTPILGQALAPMAQSQWRKEEALTPVRPPVIYVLSPTPVFSPTATKSLAAVTKVPFFGLKRSKTASPSPTRTFTRIRPTVVPTDTPTVQVLADKAQTIVSNDTTANIYLSFADGPGTYRVEVLDRDGKHLRNLFERSVVAQTDTWVDWDGKNDLGEDVPLGLAQVLFFKNDKLLKKIFVLRENLNP